MEKEEDIFPVSTKWLLDSIGETGRNSVESVFMILCQKTGSKGTGFLYKDQYVITNWHVIKDCQPSEIFALASNGKQIKFKQLVYDKNKDLALLTLEIPLKGGFEFDDENEIKPGIQISTWGFPLAYNGPAPLLSVGHISGFRDHKESDTSPIVKHVVVNGAFNPGNSGGPVFNSGSDKLIGVVVSKHTPITPFLLSAINALATNKSGICYTATDEKGTTIQFVESQIVAELLVYFRTLTQVMIGEFIDKSELKEFLKANDIT